MDLRELQNAETEMLKAVTDLCDSYGLTYTLYCGSLLGAIRHKGFIPWDDDVDIAMPLRDYRRFLKHGSELPAPYVVQYPGGTRGYNLNWAKVFADGTTFMDQRLEGIGRTEFRMHQGISIDIYPMIGAAGSERGQRLQRGLLRVAWGMSMPEFNKATGFADNPDRKHRLAAKLPYPGRKLIIDACLKLAMRDPEGCEMVGTIDAAPFEGKYRCSDWKELTRAQFGAYEFVIPVRYDKLLRRIYGEYMKLPPEENRTAHYGERATIIDMERDYREYQQK